jgi:hypothetical protein
MKSCVSVSLAIGILHCVGAASFAATTTTTTTTAPPRPCSRRGRIRGTLGARNGHTTALFAGECQSFLDNLIAGLGRHQNLERAHLLQASVEVFLLVVNGELAVWSMVTDFTVPVLLGNIAAPHYFDLLCAGIPRRASRSE